MPPIPKKVIHLLSGGLDSVTLLHQLCGELGAANIHALMFNYHQQHGEQELGWAKYHCHLLGVNCTRVDLPALGGLNDSSWVVPNRNAIMINIAVNQAIQAGAESVTIGCNADDESGFPDCRKAFLQLVNTTLTTAEIHVEVCAPYLEKRKWEIAAIAREIGVKLEQIWTCYRGGCEPCGTCPACLKLSSACK